MESTTVSIPVNVRLTREMVDHIDDYRSTDDIAFSTTVRMMVRRGLEASGYQFKTPARSRERA